MVGRPGLPASTWVDPAARPTNWDGQKVAAFVLSARDSIRLGAEESLARELTSRGAQGIAGHTIVPKEVTEDQDKVRELLREGEFGDRPTMQRLNPYG